jgi:hypothetical protein
MPLTSGLPPQPDAGHGSTCTARPARSSIPSWLELHRQSARGPVVTRVPSLGTFIEYWLTEIVRPNLAPATAANYDTFARLYIVPDLGDRRLDKLTVREVQSWINGLRTRCQCCAQGKDAAREKPRCCSIGKCCGQIASDRTIRDAWATLRIILGNAVREEMLARNIAGLIRTPTSRSRKAKPWTVEEAQQFLESARSDDDPLYAAYVLILVLGLRRGLASHQAGIQAVPASKLYLHAMHSVVDWFAYAVWIDGQLSRSLSLSPDSGIMEDVGAPQPFEESYWAGHHPAVDPEDTDPDDEPYPLPFHPLDLAETALQELLGFTFEGLPRADDADPFEIPLAGFKIS